jgi:hypothetical protein
LGAWAKDFSRRFFVGAVKPNSGAGRRRLGLAAEATTQESSGNPMRLIHVLFVGALLVAHLTLGRCCSAGTITAVGHVTALTHVSQLGPIVGTGDFNEGSPLTQVPFNTYAASGLVMQGDNKEFSTILPGSVSNGLAFLPFYDDSSDRFPAPIGGGGTQSGPNANIGLVATFTISVTQFGLTLSRNGTQFITAWRGDGTLIGQVRWDPDLDASFVGLDAMGVPIAMIAVGNDDVYGGATYSIAGQTTTFDNLIWAIPEPNSLLLGVISVALGCFAKRRRRVDGWERRKSGDELLT